MHGGMVNQTEIGLTENIIKNVGYLCCKVLATSWVGVMKSTRDQEGPFIEMEGIFP